MFVGRQSRNCRHSRQSSHKKLAGHGTFVKDSFYNIILEFLQKRPRGWAAVPFVRLCLAVVKFHLIHRLKSGHRLPLDLTNPDRSVEGLANDVVGYFLCEQDDPPYPWIFDYLALRGYSQFTGEEMPEVWRVLRSVLLGFTDKHVFKIGREENPEMGRTAKALEAALRLLASDGEITMTEIEHGARTLVRSTTVTEVLTDREMITPHHLLLLVAEVYANTANMVELCRQTIKLVSEQDKFQRRFFKHEFLEAAKSVVSIHAEIWSPGLASVPGPIAQLLKQEVEQERRNTLEHATGSLIAEQLHKARIKGEEAPRLFVAVERYLLDVCNYAFDGLPTYFREALPGVKKASYREDYKYAFETVTNRSREDLFDRIRKNPTIRKLRHYL